MSEMAQTADHLLVIGRGRILADASTDEFINGHSDRSVRVRAVEQTDLALALIQHGGVIDRSSDGALVVTGLDSTAIGAVASAAGVSLIELAPQGSSLEDAFFDLTKDETDYHAGQLAASTQGI
jgi:ABC-2 type transport system ATP-binding protein